MLDPTTDTRDPTANGPLGPEAVKEQQAKAPKLLPVKDGSRSADRKRELFVDEYLRNGRNATQAAIFAGYKVESAGTKGWQMLKRVDVQAMIQAKEAVIVGKTVATAEWIEDRLAHEATHAESDAARVAALNLLAKVRGMYAPERQIHSFDGSLFATMGDDES